MTVVCRQSAAGHRERLKGTWDDTERDGSGGDVECRPQSWNRQGELDIGEWDDAGLAAHNLGNREASAAIAAFAEALLKPDVVAAVARDLKTYEESGTEDFPGWFNSGERWEYEGMAKVALQSALAAITAFGADDDGGES